MLEGPFSRVPILLKRVDADFSRILRHVRMENLCEKETLRCALWKTTFDDELAAEYAALVCRLN